MEHTQDNDKAPCLMENNVIEKIPIQQCYPRSAWVPRLATMIVS